MWKENCVIRAYTAFTKVGGSNVQEAAAEWNASVSVNNQSELCQILDTSQIYDEEAEDIFGRGYLILQVHVLQTVNVLSEQLLWLEIVTDILKSGFDLAGGGQRLFVNCLRESDAFNSLLSMELRSGLSPPQSSPTIQPTRATPSPTKLPTVQPTRHPTRPPTNYPTGVPTLKPTEAPTWHPTRAPTSNPSSKPSAVPSFSPTLIPSYLPTHVPSNMPTAEPSKASAVPTEFLSFVPTTSPTIIPTALVVKAVPATSPDSNVAPTESSKGSILTEPIIITAIAAAAAISLSCLFVACFFWRYRKHRPRRRKQPKFSLTSRDAQQSKDNRNMIPGIVELDQQSLADTTLGEQTAGRRPKSSKKHAQVKKRLPPQSAKRPSAQAILPLESFDESSLYTTPFSIQHDDRSHCFPSSTSFVMTSQVARPLDYEGGILFPRSDSATTSSDGVSSFGPPLGQGAVEGSQVGSGSIAVSHVDGPIDLDSEAPFLSRLGIPSQYRQARVNKEKSEISPEVEDTSSAFDMDTWSCDFEEFEKGQEFYQSEAISRSPSLSSKTTTKVGNVSSVLGTLDETVAEHRDHGSREIQAGNDGSVYMGRSLAHADENDSAILYNALMNDREKLEQSSSPSSFKSPKSRGADVSPTQSFPMRRSPKQVTPNGDGRSSLAQLLDSVPSVITPPKIDVVKPADLPAHRDADIEQVLNTNLSKEDESTLLGLQFKDEESASSASTGISANPWLFGKVEESLGPKSTTADMESLSGKSNLSVRSPGTRSRTGAESMVSFGSQASYKSGLAQSEITYTSHDLQRLEKQLAALESDHLSTSSAGVSSLTGASLARASISSRSRGPRVSRRKRIVVMVPPGKLGVILANHHDGKGTVVAEIRESSPLHRMLSPGDKLVAIDDEDVTGMVVSQITSLMASKADRERRLTVITSVAQQYSK